MKLLRQFFFSIFILCTPHLVHSADLILDASGELLKGESALYIVDTTGTMEPVRFDLFPVDGDMGLYIWSSYDDFLAGSATTRSLAPIPLCVSDNTGNRVETCTFTGETALGKNIVYVEVYANTVSGRGGFRIEGSVEFPYTAQENSDYNQGLLDGIAEANVMLFIKRFYELGLEREYDDSGLIYWVRQLVSEAKNASNVANGFFFSQEFIDKQYTDVQFVQIAYRTLLDREADENGLAYWVGKLQTGTSRESVVNGFIYSDEFADLAQYYGIIAYGSGNFQPIPDGTTFYGQGFDQAQLFTATNSDVMEFVKGFYELVLDQPFVAEGMDFWIVQLVTQAGTAADITAEFFFSDEFINRGTSNTQFVQIAYQTLLGREADTDGLNYWVEKLRSGVSRAQVLQSLLNSAEFSDIADSLNIIAI